VSSSMPSRCFSVFGLCVCVHIKLLLPQSEPQLWRRWQQLAIEDIVNMRMSLPLWHTKTFIGRADTIKTLFFLSRAQQQHIWPWRTLAAHVGLENAAENPFAAQRQLNSIMWCLFPPPLLQSVPFCVTRGGLFSLQIYEPAAL
jgi:hypothetical protein